MATFGSRMIQVTTGVALEVCEFHVVGRDAVADDGPGSEKPWQP